LREFAVDLRGYATLHRNQDRLDVKCSIRLTLDPNHLVAFAKSKQLIIRQGRLILKANGQGHVGNLKVHNPTSASAKFMGIV